MRVRTMYCHHACGCLLTRFTVCASRGCLVGHPAVYHLTELPCFVSDKYMVLFDPQVSVGTVSPPSGGSVPH